MTQHASEHKDVCHICLNDEVPSLRATRNTKKDNWICCDVCKCWFHAKCGGITVSQYNRIEKDHIWFKCIVCCLNQIRILDSEDDSTEEHLSFHSRVESATQRRLEHRKGGRKKLASVPPSQVVYDNPSSDKSSATVSESVDQCLSDICKNSPLVNASGDCSCVELLECKESSDITECKNFTVSHQSDIDKILIVDNIDNCGQFSSSRRILKEVNLFCPDIKIEFAYSLAKGGIAIHTTCREDRDRLLKELPVESFGSGIKHLPKGHCNTSQDSSVLFIKGVDTSVDVRNLQEDFGKQGISVQEIRRLTKRHTGRPIQVVKVKCCEQSSQQLLDSVIVINNKLCCVEKERAVRVIRCFNCQCFGHLARHCKSSRHCEFCGDSHGVNDICTRDVQCFNCSGCHPASSAKCSVYRTRYESLAVQYPKCQYFHSSLEASST